MDLGKLDKYLEIGEIISKSFLSAVGISTLVVFVCLVLGGNLAPVAGVIYGSIAFLASFVLFLFIETWLARNPGLCRKTTYIYSLLVICLAPIVFYIAIDYKEIARDIKGFARDFSHTARMEHAPPLTEQERMLLQSTRLNLRVGVENSHSNRLFIRDLQETCLFEEVGELEQLERADIIATIFRQYSGDKVGWRFYLRRPENPQNVVKVVFIEVYYWLQVYLDSSKPKADRHQYTDRLTVELIKASQTLFGKNELRSRDSMAITPNEKLSCKRIQE